MSDPHDVISAFLDDEPFDPDQLAEALSQPDGREVLLDLIALRHLVQPASKEAPVSSQRQPKRPLYALVAAAAVLLALVGGYLVGQGRSGATLSAPPPATRVVEASAAWRDVSTERMP